MRDTAEHPIDNIITITCFCIFFVVVNHIFDHRLVVIIIKYYAILVKRGLVTSSDKLKRTDKENQLRFDSFQQSDTPHNHSQVSQTS